MKGVYHISIVPRSICTAISAISPTSISDTQTASALALMTLSALNTRSNAPSGIAPPPAEARQHDESQHDGIPFQFLNRPVKRGT